MAPEYTHAPVLLKEVLEGLKMRADGIYIDGTFGRGGHAGAMLERLSDAGRLIAMDKDPEAVQEAQRRFGSDTRLQVVRSTFAMLQQVAQEHEVAGKVSGVLFDLGVSSPQLDDPRRGFSFSHDGPLDMRMDPQTGESAAEWLAHASEADIAAVLKNLGEERFARRIARAIVESRTATPLVTTKQLADLIAANVPTRERGKHPATRSFQAIRMHINRELDDLAAGLRQAVEVLEAGGRLAVISFHSLEDRLVKQFIRREVQGPQLPPDLPVRHVQTMGRLRAIGKAQRAQEVEVAANPRARSAVLRIAERLA